MRSKKIDRQEDVDFRMLRLLEKHPEASQRQISREVGVSLGAVNYCLRALIDKGHIKLANMRASKNKIGYVYVLTPAGIAHRTNLALKFIERKFLEYQEIEIEIERIKIDYKDELPAWIFDSQKQ